MARENTALVAFNRGRVSQLALARTDIKRIALSAETMTNWVPRVLGSMSLRAGLGYLGSSKSDNTARYVPFVFSTDDTALVELTALVMRVWISDTVLTRVSVSTAITNGEFLTDVSGWTDDDEAGGTSSWDAGYLRLVGDGTAAAIRTQSVTVAAADQNVEHALRIVVNRGPVTLRVGSTSGGDDYITETELGTGIHSLAFTPTGSPVYVRFLSRLERIIYVDSCTIEAAGVVELTSPWPAAALDDIRYDQSGDVIFLACDGYQQRRIERRRARSWSIVTYYAEDGPFRTENTGPITLTPSSLTGNANLTASAALFRSTHVGALFRVTSVGQSVTGSVTSIASTFTSPIRVTGVSPERTFTIVISGTWTGTVVLQRSLTSASGPWSDVAGKSWTANTTETYDDALDNQIVWYQLGCKASGWGSGTISLSLSIATGSITGIGRVISFSTSVLVSVEILSAFGGTTASDIWSEGRWSDYRGWPSAVAFAEGRLWWAGKDFLDGSVSDAFTSFDDTFEGDAGPIARSIGSGPVDTINWLLSSQRLLVGTEGSEIVAKASTQDEPITPTACSLRAVSTQGSAAVQAVKIDKRGVYVQRGGTRVMELSIGDDLEYGSTDLTLLCPEIGTPSITRMAVQRQPDTRIHAMRSDGTVALGVFDKAESVLCWCDIETDGDVEDVVILPGDDGTGEDSVYYLVKRTINGSTKRYLERWALESQCIGATLNRQADSFVVWTGSSSTTITGLSHLEGESVVVWAGGKDLGTYTVTSGQITGVSESVTSAVIGVAYEAAFKSSKLSRAQGGTALTQPKRISHLGLVLVNAHYQGLQYGPDSATLEDMPLVENGTAVASNTVHATYDEMSFEFPGRWDTDSRLYLKAMAPRPCTVLAAIMSVETHDRT